MPVLTTSEVAAMLGVTPAAVRVWERTGKLPAVKSPRGVRFFDSRAVQLFAVKRATTTRPVRRAIKRPRRHSQ